MAEYRLAYRDLTKREALKRSNQFKRDFKTKTRIRKDPNGKYMVWVLSTK